MSDDKKTYWKQQLARSRMQLRLLLGRLSKEQWQSKVYSDGDEWRVLDVVAHLLESEKGMSVQIHKIRTGRESLPADFDVLRWNAGLTKRMGDPSPKDLMQGLAETRAKTLEVMDSLKDEEWDLVGRQAVRGDITIEQFYETIHGHELEHTENIKTVLG